MARRAQTRSASIRWMIRADIPEVIDIEQHSRHFPWDEAEFVRTLRQRNTIGMVTEVCQEVAGFIVFQLEQKQLSLLNMAVHRKYRRSGVGSAMMAKLIGKLSKNRRHRIVANVSEYDLNMHLFLRSHKFIATDVLRSHFGGGEDAYRMVYSVARQHRWANSA